MLIKCVYCYFYSTPTATFSNKEQSWLRQKRRICILGEETTIVVSALLLAREICKYLALLRRNWTLTFDCRKKSIWVKKETFVSYKLLQLLWFRRTIYLIVSHWLRQSTWPCKSRQWVEFRVTHFLFDGDSYLRQTANAFGSISVVGDNELLTVWEEVQFVELVGSGFPWDVDGAERHVNIRHNSLLRFFAHNVRRRY